ncbi:unnamed protein product [Linum trigynum]|uniref:Uncharacterized protein n=1 Tax=Linum trigynum TaxID=586398 RepID=A0AAV2DZ97_9ROSI
MIHTNCPPQPKTTTILLNRLPSAVASPKSTTATFSSLLSPPAALTPSPKILCHLRTDHQWGSISTPLNPSTNPKSRFVDKSAVTRADSPPSIAFLALSPFQLVGEPRSRFVAKRRQQGQTLLLPPTTDRLPPNFPDLSIRPISPAASLAASAVDPST